MEGRKSDPKSKYSESDEKVLLSRVSCFLNEPGSYLKVGSNDIREIGWENVEIRSREESEIWNVGRYFKVSKIVTTDRLAGKTSWASTLKWWKKMLLIFNSFAIMCDGRNLKMFVSAFVVSLLSCYPKLDITLSPLCSSEMSSFGPAVLTIFSFAQYWPSRPPVLYQTKPAWTLTAHQILFASKQNKHY